MYGSVAHGGFPERLVTGQSGDYQLLQAFQSKTMIARPLGGQTRYRSHLDCA